MDREVALILLIAFVILAGCEEPDTSGGAPAEPYTSSYAGAALPPARFWTSTGRIGMSSRNQRYVALA